MKKVFLITIFLLIGITAHALDLQVGIKAPNWVLEDHQKKVFTIDSWPGKILFINYVDPDESDLNEHLTDAMKQAQKEGRLKRELYKGIGIADCDATWKPNFLIKTIAGKKAEKYKTVILFDYDASLRKSWNLAKDTSNLIILDKNKICRAIVRGRIDESKVESFINLIAELQKE